MEDGRPWGGRGLTLLKPDGWFEEGHKEEHICPPPNDAYVPLEIFAEASQKRLHTLHVFIIPHLATSLWRKQLVKDAALMFEIPMGLEIWPLAHHEPLFVAFVLPLEHKNQVQSSMGG